MIIIMKCEVCTPRCIIGVCYAIVLSFFLRYVKLSMFLENSLLFVCRNQNNTVSLYQQKRITTNNLKIKAMTTFNNTMTIEEATTLFQFNGQAMYPKTKHNVEVMKTVVDNYLRKLQGK